MMARTILSPAARLSRRIKGALRSLFVMVAMVAAASLLAGMATREVTQISSDEALPFDSDTRLGVLDNGLTYYIRDNKTPPARAELMLAVRVGSVYEREDQLGLAHFAEHMLFNGTAKYPGNELQKLLERNGVGFGKHINAYTGFEETVYFLNVPTDKDDKDDLLELGVEVLEQWAHQALFTAEEIELERGVVLEEWRLSLGAYSRAITEHLAVMFKGSRFADRLPIGEPDVIETFEHDTLRDIYREWYRPDRMAVIAVGDFNVDDMEALITRYFAPIPNPSTPAPEIDRTVPEHDGTRIGFSYDPEAINTTVSLWNRAPDFKLITRADYRQSIIEELYQIILSMRLDRLRETESAPFFQSFGTFANLTQETRYFFLDMLGNTDRIDAMIDATVTEIRRIAEYGVGEREFEIAVNALVNRYETAYRMRDTKQSDAYSQDYNLHFLYSVASPSIEYELELVKELLGEIDRSDIGRVAAIAADFDGSTLWISAPEGDETPLPDEEQIRSIFTEAMERPIAAYQEEIEDRPLIAELPEPGKIVSESRDDELDILTWTLSNGARVLFKQTDFSKDRISFSAHSWGGVSVSDDDNWRSLQLASDIVSQMGFGGFSGAQLQSILSDKDVDVRPIIGFFSEFFEGRGSSTDIETFMQLLYLTFVAPNSDEVTYNNYISLVREFFANRDRDPQAVIHDRHTEIYFGNHPRFKPQQVEDIDKIELDKVVEGYRERFADADDFVFAFVGDISPDDFRPLVERYLASLPSLPTSEEPRDLQINYADRTYDERVYAGIEEQSSTIISFHGSIDWSPQETLRLELLNRVFRIILNEQIREERGGSYGVGVYAITDRLPVERYRFAIEFGADPERIEELREDIFAIIDNVQQEGLEQDYLDRAREIMLNEHQTGLSENEYWLRTIMQSLLGDYEIGRILDFPEELANIDREDIEEAARRYLDLSNYVSVTLFPKSREQ